MCVLLERISCLEVRKFQDTINATNFQYLFSFLPTNKVAVFKFVKKPYQGLLHLRSEVQLSNLMLMRRNMWQETSHSDCTAIYFYMCISHSITHQYQYVEIQCVQYLYIFVLTQNWWCVYSIHTGQPLIMNMLST